MAQPSGSLNGGIIGASNKTSFGKGRITEKTSTGTITTFDGGIPGQKIHIVHTDATDFDVTGTTLKGGAADITTASGDVTSWVYNGTNWYLTNFMDVSTNLSSGH